MILKEALTILEEKREYAISLGRLQEVIALGLAIEALKAVQEARLGILDLMPSVLPGETQE